jgi:hypothetical protein
MLVVSSAITTVIDSVIRFAGRHVVGLHPGVARMHGREHDFRLGQLLATLIHNAGARPQSTESHPIALVVAPFGRALIPRPGQPS